MPEGDSEYCSAPSGYKAERSVATRAEGGGLDEVGEGVGERRQPFWTSEG